MFPPVFESDNVKGFSRFSFFPKSHLAHATALLTGITLLSAPLQFAFGQTDFQLFVSSYSNSVIMRYDSSGAPLPSGANSGAIYASGGSATNALGHSTGLTFGPDGNLYTWGQDNYQILRFQGPTNATPGAFMGDFTGRDYPAGATNTPGCSTCTGQIISGGGMGVVFGGPNTNLYIIGDDNLRIQEFDGVTGAFVNRLDPTNQATLERFGPKQLIFGSDTNLFLYATDTGNQRLKKYNTATRLTWNSPGSGNATDLASGANVNNLFGVAFGPNGDIYVSDLVGTTNFTAQSFGRIAHYDSSGVFVAYMTNAPSLDSPRGIAFGPDGKFYVADWMNNEILRYDIVSGSSFGNEQVFVTGGSGGLDAPVFMSFVNVPVSEVPEPSTFLLSAMGTACLFAARRRFLGRS